MIPTSHVRMPIGLTYSLYLPASANTGRQQMMAQVGHAVTAPGFALAQL